MLRYGVRSYGNCKFSSIVWTIMQAYLACVSHLRTKEYCRKTTLARKRKLFWEANKWVRNVDPATGMVVSHSVVPRTEKGQFTDMKNLRCRSDMQLSSKSWLFAARVRCVLLYFSRTRVPMAEGIRRLRYLNIVDLEVPAEYGRRMLWITQVRRRLVFGKGSGLEQVRVAGTSFAQTEGLIVRCSSSQVMVGRWCSQNTRMESTRYLEAMAGDDGWDGIMQHSVSLLHLKLFFFCIDQ